MSKYTDSDFGFSFWYPSGRSVESNDAMGNQNLMRRSINITGPAQKIQLTEVNSNEGVSGGNPAKTGGTDKYYFDASSHAWMHSFVWACGENPCNPTSTEPADVSINTMGGLHIFTFGGTFGENVAVPLTADNFVIAEISGGETVPLIKTIVATNPAVAIPVSTAQQIATIQAEQQSYAGQ